MVIDFFPSMSGEWAHHVMAALSSRFSMSGGLANEHGNQSRKASFHGKYQEIIPGELTLLVIESDAPGMVVLKSSQLPVNEIYIFQLKYNSGPQLPGQANVSDQQVTGIFTSTDLSFLCEIKPNGRFQTIYVSMSRDYLLGMLEVLKPAETTEWGKIFETNRSFHHPFSLELGEYLILEDFFNANEGLKDLNELDYAVNIKKLIVIFLERLLNPKRPRQSGASVEDYITIRNIVGTMQGNLSRKYHLDELSDLYKMPSNRLSKMFYMVTGKTFAGYYTQIRMEEALRLINKNEAESVGALASTIGYKTVQEFSKAFAAYYGYTPGQLMKNNHKISW